MMGEQKVKNQAEEKYVIQKWIKNDYSKVNDDKKAGEGANITKEILDKYKPGSSEKDEAQAEE